MKIKKTISTTTLAAVCSIFLFDQTVLTAHANDIDIADLALQNMEMHLDQGILEAQKNEVLIKEADQNNLPAQSKEPFTHHQRNIEARWKRLTPRLQTAMIKKLNQRIMNSTETEIDAQLKNSQAILNQTKLNDSKADHEMSSIMNKTLKEKKDFLMDHSSSQMKLLTEKLPNAIAAAHGALPFLFHAKSKIRELRQNLFAQKQGLPSRKPASFTATEGMTYLVLALILIAAIVYGLVPFLATLRLSINPADYNLILIIGCFIALGFIIKMACD